MKLKSDEIICSNCNGTGSTNNSFVCNKCLGDGTLDWIENIVGKKSRYIKPGVYIKEIDLSE